MLKDDFYSLKKSVEQQKLIDELVKAASEWLMQTVRSRGSMNAAETVLANALEEVQSSHDKYKKRAKLKSGSWINNLDSGTIFKVSVIISLEKIKNDVFLCPWKMG